MNNYKDYLESELSKIFIKNKKFEIDDDVVEVLQQAEEYTRVIHFCDKEIRFPLLSIDRVVDTYKTGFLWTKKVEEQAGFMVVFKRGEVEFGNLNCDECRRLLTLAHFCRKPIILWYEYETGDWYLFYDYGVTTIENEDFRDVLSQLVDTIVEICGKEYVNRHNHER